MEIADVGVKNETTDPGQDGVSQVAMERGHRASHNSTAKPIPHDQVVSLPDLGYEGSDRRPVIRIVSIAHNDDGAACFADTARESGAIPLPDFMNHTTV